MKQQTIYGMSIFIFIILASTLIQEHFFAKKPEPAECCHAPSGQGTLAFAALGNDLSFVAKHENPRSFHYQAKFGDMISFETPDGKSAQAFFIKSAKTSDKYLFVFHEWWGLNDYIKQEAENFYQSLENVNVVAIDMYDGKVASTREEASSYMQGVSPERMEAILKGATAYAGNNAEIATVGWCFGGSVSLQSSLAADSRAKACIIYYGMPVQDPEVLKSLNAKVLGIFAVNDQWINPEVVGKFEETLKSLGKSVEIRNYDADHAFANPSNPRYNKAFAEEAFALSISFLKENF